MQRGCHQSTPSADGRKYNIIVFGVAACPRGTSHAERLSRDEAAIVQSFQDQIPSFCAMCIRDSFRLGKYTESNSHPRPILVSLNRVADVNLVLSKRSSFPSVGLRVKPDLSPEERHIESLLLKERRLLIDKGTDRGLMKLHRNCLYVSGRIHCRVKNGILLQSTSLVDQAPQLESLSENSPQEPLQSRDIDGSSLLTSSEPHQSQCNFSLQSSPPTSSLQRPSPPTSSFPSPPPTFSGKSNNA